jgi:hypothetical protein
MGACTGNPNHLNTTYLDSFAERNPTLASFVECHGFGCAEASRVGVSSDGWRRVAAAFKPRAKDAQTERRQIAHAVALMELVVGAQTGTAVHQWTHKDMMILPNFDSDPSQLDCVDEAVNTWTYMALMEREGLFHFHRVANLSFGGSLTDPNPRNTAVVQEIGGAYFAVDASLVDSGVPPPIIPLQTWLGHWPPELPPSEPRVKLAG